MAIAVNRDDRVIPEIGHFALVLALVVAWIQAIVPIVGTYRGLPELMALGRPAAWTQLIMIMIAFLMLVQAFVQNDFSVAYVAQNSNSALPIQYRISAVWGGHEGSLVLWVLILSLWGVAVTVFSRSLPDYFLARVLSILGFIGGGFLLFILLTSNPFERLFPPALDGRDLNPLLQDPGLIIHPPMLYMGYVGFSVAFAFAVAALLSGRLDATWARWSRPWTTAAWLFLTLGIVLGSWWAYYELGWGGWWFWDPVENASFMPWLAGTALIHCLAVSEKRGAFKSWTVLLAIMAFSLSLLGTFLVRSGVLVSVHAFASDPQRGIFILGFLGVVVGFSLGLYALRAPRIRSIGQFTLWSRETLLLTNNVLLMAALAAVLMGTLAPVVLDALDLGKISVGAPYFDLVFAPLMLLLIVLVGVGPWISWRQGAVRPILKKLRWVLMASGLLGLAIPLLVAGKATLMVVAALAIAAWAILSSVQYLFERLKKNKGRHGLPTSVYGMVMAHIGIGVFVIGVTLNTAFSIERDVHMRIGDQVQINDFVFLLEAVRPIQGPNYHSDQAWVSVSRDGQPVVVLQPERRVYWVQNMPMTEAAIDTTLLRDLYVALAEPRGSDGWALRIYHKPLQAWIWLGCVLMVLGGVLAVLDRRYRLVSRHPSVTLQTGNTQPLQTPAR